MTSPRQQTGCSFAVALLSVLPLTAQSAPTGMEQQVLVTDTMHSDMGYHRGPDGRMVARGASFDADPAEVGPLLGNDLRNALSNVGPFGWLVFWMQGNSDLLGMTAAEWHFEALDIGTATEELRQFIVSPIDATRSAGWQRAELLDRALAIDVLRRRDVVEKCPEIRVLAEDDEAPPLLRERARGALAGRLVADEDRHDIAPSDLLLPPAFDGSISVDHRRLPDMSWWTRLGRRGGMLSSARVIDQQGGEVAADILRSGQLIADLVCELPFDLVLTNGNQRVDRTCVVVTFTPVAGVGQGPVTISSCLVGRFDYVDVGRDGPWLTDLAERTLVVEASPTRLRLGKGRERPAMAARILDDRDAAIHVHVPTNSKAWPALVAMQAPPTIEADVFVRFGETFVIEADIVARDNDAAAAWQTRLEEYRGQRDQLAAQLPEMAREHELVGRIMEAVFTPEIAVEGDRCKVRVTLRDFGREEFERLVIEVLTRRGF